MGWQCIVYESWQDREGQGGGQDRAGLHWAVVR